MSDEIKNTEAEEQVSAPAEETPAAAPAETPAAAPTETPAAAPAETPAAASTERPAAAPREYRPREDGPRGPRPDGRRPRFKSEDGDGREDDFSRSEMGPRMPRFRKKVCRFCHDKNAVIDYKRSDILESFITDRGKILPRRITGTCSKHQRAIAREIKIARSIALLTYVEK